MCERKEEKNEENQKRHSFPCANDVRSMFDASLALLSAWLWQAPNTPTAICAPNAYFFSIFHLSLVGGALKCHDYTVALCVCARAVDLWLWWWRWFGVLSTGPTAFFSACVPRNVMADGKHASTAKNVDETNSPARIITYGWMRGSLVEETKKKNQQ